MVRLNPGVGAGHSAKVVTAGKETKFGVQREDIPHLAEICARHGLKLAGLNQHVGSLFMEAGAFTQAMRRLLDAAGGFTGLKYIDFGGGFGIPYRKYAGEAPLDLEAFSRESTGLLRDWVRKTGYAGCFLIEPGRYVTAECGLILGSVTAIKNNGPARYACTDVGFNILPRPMLYGAFHDVEIYRRSADTGAPELPQHIVGNICESGDILHQAYPLPEIMQGDILGFLDTGAYCYSMASTYNQRVRPAEVLVRSEGGIQLIRRRETVEDLMRLHTPL
jgi:diaminopimelate decarboxylase